MKANKETKKFHFSDIYYCHAMNGYWLHFFFDKAQKVSNDFMLKTQEWLREAGYADYKDLALNLTLNAGELNSLENLGLIQRVANSQCQIPLLYTLKENKTICLSPEDDSQIPLGQYAFTQEGSQLYQIIGGTGEEAVLEIIVQYLKSMHIKILVQSAVYG